MTRYSFTIKFALVCAANLITVNAAMADVGAPNVCPPAVPGSGDWPPAGKARVWTGTWNGSIHLGTCYELTYLGTDRNNWTCFDSTMGLPNDVIQSVETGPDVRLFLFQNSMGQREESQPFIVEPGHGWGDLGSWKNKISAARLVSVNRGTPGQLTLCTDPTGNSAYDCVNLFTSDLMGHSQSYPTPLSMCFHNDSASWACNAYNSWSNPTLFRDNNYGGSSPFTVAPGCSNLAWLGFDNITSSVK